MCVCVCVCITGNEHNWHDMAEDILDIFFSNTEAVEENNDDTSFAISKTDTNETSIMSAGNSSIHESSHKSTI